MADFCLLVIACQALPVTGYASRQFGVMGAVHLFVGLVLLVGPALLLLTLGRFRRNLRHKQGKWLKLLRRSIGLLLACLFLFQVAFIYLTMGHWTQIWWLMLNLSSAGIQMLCFRSLRSLAPLKAPSDFA